MTFGAHSPLICGGLLHSRNFNESAILNKGIYATPRGLFILSTPMGTKEMALFTSAMDEALVELKPYIQDEYPHLLL